MNEQKTQLMLLGLLDDANQYQNVMTPQSSIVDSAVVSVLLETQANKNYTLLQHIELLADANIRSSSYISILENSRRRFSRLLTYIQQEYTGFDELTEEAIRQALI
jgi:hypothetical protein